MSHQSKSESYEKSVRFKFYFTIQYVLSSVLVNDRLVAADEDGQVM